METVMIQKDELYLIIRQAIRDELSSEVKLTDFAMSQLEEARKTSKSEYINIDEF
jgi:hypothetical protein